MNRYEAMLLLRVDLGQEKTKSLMQDINDVILQNKGKIVSSGIWQENRKLAYPIKKQKEATYYLLNFEAEPQSLSKIQQDYKLNENILRFMIFKLE
jgi:small subunit ribosomal protein S6